MTNQKEKFGERIETGTRESAGGIMGAVKDKMENVSAGASQLVDKAKDATREWASTASDAAYQARERVQEAASTAAHKAEDFGQELTRLVRQYPLQALLIGFGVGFLLAQVTVTRHT